ncbi:uncharacterized protein PAC_18450 [Phialocephala subalpina]|uniref:Uncharacterized protein n=1 Tax=Phialocephala subalpina TaxID=576137 RepID=A0A1L7XU47_9HELO|nr:uncharacterized protein PAC_18450 [Phialocephala subalpina]
MRLRDGKFTFLTLEDETAHNAAILGSFRKNREWLHRSRIERTWSQEPLFIKLTPTLKIPFITWDHLQDFCNRGVAIYAPNNGRFGCRNMKWLEDYAYENWWKLVFLEAAEGGQMDTDDVVAAHGKLLARLSKCQPWFGWPLSISKFDGPCILDQQQPEQYKVKPLYRALVIVADIKPRSEDKEKMVVKLVRTGITAGLSAPVSFAELGMDKDVVSVTLEEALNFVVKLEDREEAAFPKLYPTVLHNQLGRLSYWTGFSRREGYTGGPLDTPSSEWINEDA